MPVDGIAWGKRKMHPGYSRGGVSLMRPSKKGLRDIGVLTASVVVFAVYATPVLAQEAVTTESMVRQLADLETTADIDVAALRQQALDRVKSRADNTSLKDRKSVV